MRYSGDGACIFCLGQLHILKGRGMRGNPMLGGPAILFWPGFRSHALSSCSVFPFLQPDTFIFTLAICRCRH